VHREARRLSNSLACRRCGTTHAGATAKTLLTFWRTMRAERGATGMAYTLGDAARATGAAKSTIFRAIKAGRLSATRTDVGQWAIEPAELFRVFPPLAVPDSNPPMVGPAQRDATADILVAELRGIIADLRADRDHWRDAFHAAQRLLPVPAERRALSRKREAFSARGVGCGRSLSGAERRGSRYARAGAPRRRAAFAQ
jgi:hypothetical protein